MTPNVHLAPLALGAGGATPWDFSPIWFALLAIVLPAILWTALAWKRALEEDPYRLRRAGRRELRKLLARLQRGGGTPRPVDLQAWARQYSEEEFLRRMAAILKASTESRTESVAP